MKSVSINSGRLDYLDAVRGLALMLGVAFHASLSFIPVSIGWAVMDISTSPLVGAFIVISHSFRMPLFFLVAGYFSHMTFHRKGGGTFIKSRLQRLMIPFIVGWFILWPLIASGWAMGMASMRGTVDIWAGLKSGYGMLLQLPDHLFVSTHLWFLYYLMLITALVLVGRLALSYTGSGYRRLVDGTDRALAWVSDKSFSLVIFAVPTSRVLWHMNGWGLDTPDKSLVPHIPVLLVYGSCFLLGWILHRNRETFENLTRLTVVRVAITVVACGLCIVLSEIQGDPSHPQYTQARLAYGLTYSFMLWGLVFQVIGAMRLLIRKEYPIVRYIADSSYWMYLIHLPIVVWLQVTVAEWPWHWTFKMAFITLVTILFALVTYGLFVRHTWIGAVLSGKRIRKQGA